ncbi:hypothetical protein FACS1894192_04800 [Bacilli bacterium]|nr:hypothetical protein FACS1894192_04800 [Bacilli bacterium]
MENSIQYKNFKSRYINTAKKSSNSANAYLSSFHKVVFASDGKSISEVADLSDFDMRVEELF